MRTRRLVAGIAAALLTATAPVVLSSVPAADAATNAATKAGYVGIVVDGDTAGCVPWHSGITGDDVLNAVAAVHYRNDGIIDQIDGNPNPPHADDTHYWSYWHDTSGTWSYSHAGASNFSPSAGSVEGWSYVNGQDEQHAPHPSENPSGLYASLCGAHDKPASGGAGAGGAGGTTHPAGRHPSSGGSTQRDARTSSSGNGASVRRRTAPTAPTATPSPSAVSSTVARRASSPAPSGSSSGPVTADPSANRSAAIAAARTVGAAPIATGSPSSAAKSSPSASGGSSSGSLTSVLVAIGLVVVLGGGATAYGLRRRRAG